MQFKAILSGPLFLFKAILLRIARALQRVCDKMPPKTIACKGVHARGNLFLMRQTP